MRKIVIIIFLITLTISSFGEPYRPYPVIYIHGYAANHYNGGNFGTVINSSHKRGVIDNPTASSPVPDKIGFYTGNDISRNVCKRLEEGKLAYKALEYNKDILNYWYERDSLFGSDSIYWIKNDAGHYKYIQNYSDIVSEDSLVINAFTETMEFDYPASGSSDSTMSHPDYLSGEQNKYPYEYQIGRGTQLKCKLKETLINYYTEGVAVYKEHPAHPGYHNDVWIKLPGDTARRLEESDLKDNAKVIFVAHSYGGVNLRQMLVDIYNQGLVDSVDGDTINYTWLYDHIDKIITVDTPHLGSPPANHNMSFAWTDASYWEYYNKFAFINGLNWLVYATYPINIWAFPDILLITKLILSSSEVEPSKYIDVPVYASAITGIVQPGVKFLQKFNLIYEDACYDLEPYDQEYQGRYSSIRNLLDTTNLKIQSKVNYSLYATTAQNNATFKNLGIILYSTSYALNTAAIVGLSETPLALIPLTLLAVASNSFIEYSKWLNSSDFVVPIKSQDPFNYFNKILENEEEKFVVKKRIIDNRFLHMSSLTNGDADACYGQNDSLLTLIEDSLFASLDFITILKDGNEVVIDLHDKSENNDYYDEQKDAFIIQTVPINIGGRCFRYFMGAGENNLTISKKKDLNFEFGIDTFYNDVFTEYGLRNDSILVYGDLSEVFNKGMNELSLSIKTRTNKTAYLTENIYIASNPIYTVEPYNKQIFNNFGDFQSIIREVHKDDVYDSLVIDSINHEIYLIRPIPDYKETLYQEYDECNFVMHEDINNNYIYIDSLQEGQLSCLSTYVFDKEDTLELPTVELNTFYIDTTTPEINLINYNECKKYSLRKNGFARLQYKPEDNFTYFFKFVENSQFDIKDENNNIVYSENIGSTPFGMTQYGEWAPADWRDYPDGYYTGIVSLSDKAGNLASDTVGFWVDNTPPELIITSGFEDTVINTNDIGKDLYFTTDEKAYVRLIFDDNYSDESIYNEINADTGRYEYTFNEAGDLDSIFTNEMWINGGRFGGDVSLPDGRYTVSMRGTDEVDNDTLWTICNNFMVDNTCPIIMNPVCMPLTINEQDSITLYFRTSELNDISINRGDVKYLIYLNDNLLDSFNIDFSSQDSVIIEKMIDVSNANNGINSIKIVAEDQTREFAVDNIGNKTYGYAQFINKTIGTYITNPADGDTLYEGVANVIEGIANDPDMSNIYPFEKYALYWFSDDGQRIERNPDQWSSEGMYTPVSYRDETCNKNESVVFNEYNSKLGVFIPESVGDYSLMLISSEKGSDLTSTFIRDVHVVSSDNIKTPDIVSVSVGTEPWNNDSTYYINESDVDTAYINYEFQNKVSDIFMEIVDEAGNEIYSSMQNHCIPILGNYPDLSQEGVYIWKDSRYHVVINTPNDSMSKYVRVESFTEDIIPIISDSTIVYGDKYIEYSGEETYKHLSFTTEDSLIQISINPFYLNIYGGNGNALIENNSLINTNYQFKWNLNDKLMNKVSSGNYAIHLTAFGTDGVGADSIIKSINIANPIRFDSLYSYPDTINILNPSANTLSITAQANQEGFVIYELYCDSDGVYELIERTDTLRLDYMNRNVYQYDDFETYNSNCITVVKLFNKYRNEVQIDTLITPILNIQVNVYDYGIYIPDGFRTSTDLNKDIYDGKGMYKYVLYNGNGEIFFDKPFDYMIEAHSARMDTLSIELTTNTIAYDTISSIIHANKSNDSITGYISLLNIDYSSLVEGSLWVYVYAQSNQRGTGVDDTVPSYANRYELGDIRDFLNDGVQTILCTNIDPYVQFTRLHFYCLNASGDTIDSLPEIDFYPDRILEIWTAKAYVNKTTNYNRLIFSDSYSDLTGYSSGIDTFIHDNVNLPTKLKFTDYLITNFEWGDFSYVDTSYFDTVSSFGKLLEVSRETVRDTEYIADLKINVYNYEDNKRLRYILNSEPYFKYYKSKLFADTVCFDSSSGNYETIELGAVEILMELPDASLILYDNCLDVPVGAIITSDTNVTLFSDAIKDMYDFGEIIRATADNGYSWNITQASEGIGSKIYSVPIEFAENQGFPYSGKVTYQLPKYYPDDNFNSYSILLKDSNDSLISNPLLRIDNMSAVVKYPDFSENHDISLDAFTLSTDAGKAGLSEIHVKNLLNARPAGFLPIYGSILPDSTTDRLHYYYNIIVKSSKGSYNLFPTYQRVPDDSTILGYINTFEEFGDMKIFVPLYYYNSDNQGTERNLGTFELTGIYRKDIIIGDEIENSDTISSIAQIMTPYKRGYMSCKLPDDSIDIAKLEYHISPEMIVENGEEPVIGQSFCPIIELKSSKTLVDNIIFSYYLTKDEIGENLMNDIEKLNYYFVNKEGIINRLPTIHNFIMEAGRKVGVQFIIDGNDYNVDDIEYITILNDSLTDQFKFSEVTISQITDSFVEITLKGQDLINRVNNEGIGFLITDPITNIYEALSNLNNGGVKRTLNIDSPLPNEGECELSRLLGIVNDSSEYINFISNSQVKVKLPKDSIYNGYNHIFIGNYSALYEARDMMTEDYINLGQQYASSDTIRNSCINEISFNYFVPKVLYYDSISNISDYSGVEITVLLTDSTNALINIYNSNGVQIHSTSISAASGETEFHWNGNLKFGESDNGVYSMEIMPFRNDGLLGESVNGVIAINRKPNISIVDPENNKWYSYSLSLLGVNNDFINNPISWTAEFDGITREMTTTPGNQTVEFSTSKILEGDSVIIRASSYDDYTNLSEDTITVGIDRTLPEITDFSTSGILRYENGDVTVYNSNRVGMTFADALSGLYRGYKIIEDDTSLIIFRPYEFDGDSYYYSIINQNNDSLITVMIKDSANNTSERSFRFKSDNQPPEILVEVGEPCFTVNDTFYITEETPIDIIVYDEGTSVTQSIYKWGMVASWQDIEGTIYADFGTESYLDLYISATDELGNTVLKKVVFGCDYYPPISTHTYQEPYYQNILNYVNNSSSMTITAYDDFSGVDRIICSVNDITGIISDSVVDYQFTDLDYGMNYLEYYSIDKIGNTEPVNRDSFFIDNLAPVTDLIITGDYYNDGDEYISDRTTLNIESTDDASGIEGTIFIINGDTIEQCQTILDHYGSNILEYYSIDNVSNFEIENTREIFMDNIAPEYTLSFNGLYIDTIPYIISSSTEILINALDDLSGIKYTQYAIDDINNAVNGNALYLTDEGLHTLYINVSDNVNNITGWMTESIYVDNTGPEVSINIDDPIYDNYITSLSMIELTATDNIGGVNEIIYYIDGTEHIYTEPFNLNGSDGAYDIQYKAIDNLGNESELYEITLILDNTPPVLSIAYNMPEYYGTHQFVTSQSSIDIFAEDMGSGVKEVNYDINGIITGTGAGPLTVSLITLDENVYNIMVNAYDNLDNYDELNEEFVVDNSSPVSQIDIGLPQYIKGDTTLITSNTPIELSAQDKPDNIPSSGVREINYGYNGVNNTVSSSEHTDYINDNDGAYEYNYFAIDNLGNIEQTNTITVELDNTAPDVVISCPYDGMFINQDIDIRGYADDKNWSRWKLEYKNTDDLTWHIITDWQTIVPSDSIMGTLSASVLANGIYAIKLTAEDLVNNVNTCEITVKVGEPNQDLELTGYLKPEGVWGGDYIYIADTQHKRAVKVDADNTLLLEIKEFQPSDVFVDNRGRIFATDQDSRVYIYTAQGDEIKIIDGHLHPKGIEVWNNKIYVADTYRNRIVIYSMNGDLLQTIPVNKHPEGIAVDEQGNIFTCIDESNEIRGYNSSGEEIFRYGVVGHGVGEFVRAVDIDVDSRGYLWVCDRNNNRVHMIDWRNELDLFILGERGQQEKFKDGMNKPEGLSIVEENGEVKYIYIADTNNDRILRYNLSEISTDNKVKYASLQNGGLEIEQFLPYPNPTDDVSTIRVVLSQPAELTINVFTLTGKLVYNYNITGTSGINEVTWNGINTEGIDVLNGVYNIQVIATSGTSSIERWSKIAIIR